MDLGELVTVHDQPLQTFIAKHNHFLFQHNYPLTSPRRTVRLATITSPRRQYSDTSSVSSSLASSSSSVSSSFSGSLSLGEESEESEPAVIVPSSMPAST